MKKHLKDMSKYKIAALMVFIALAADQITKTMALGLSGKIVTVLPFFNLVLIWNRGISFGLFNHYDSAGALILTGVSLAIVALLLVWLRQAEKKVLALAIAAVIGGALGNVIDRLRFGAVVDFLDFHVGDWHWPAFNIADSCIVLGIAMIVLDGLFSEPERKGALPDEQQKTQ